MAAKAHPEGELSVSFKSLPLETVGTNVGEVNLGVHKDVYVFVIQCILVLIYAFD
jgi:hypothetical protein